MTAPRRRSRTETLTPDGPYAPVIDRGVRPGLAAPSRSRTGSTAITRGACGTFVDARSREGRFLVAYERMLTDHVGGNPSAPVRAMIVRAARIALHLELLDERVLRDGKPFNEHDTNYYVAWSNTLSRLLARINFQPAAVPAADLMEYLARKAADPSRLTDAELEHALSLLNHLNPVATAATDADPPATDEAA